MAFIIYLLKVDHTGPFFRFSIAVFLPPRKGKNPTPRKDFRGVGKGLLLILTFPQ